MRRLKNGRYAMGLALTLLEVLTLQGAEAVSFTTNRSRLLDPCGQRVIPRGVNAGIAFPSDSAASKLEDIAKTGANTVRLTFRWQYNQSGPNQVATALQKAAQNRLLAMPALWNTSSEFEQLPFAVDFWTQPEMVAVLREHEDGILLNLANEAGGHDLSSEAFRQGYSAAILKLRQAGLHMPVVIDTAGYGRDEAYILQNAKALILADPDHNLIFSWHPWDLAQPRSRYKDFIDTANKKFIPVVLGEVSSVGATLEGEIDYSYLMQLSADTQVGWLWWWWASTHDATRQPDKHALTTDGGYGNWANVGEDVVLGPYGISETSKPIAYLATQTCNGKPLVTAKPNAPKNLTAVSTQGAEVKLSWQDMSANEKNFDVEVWDEATSRWRLVKVVAANKQQATIGAGAEFVYSLDSALDTSLNYSTTYKIRVGAYRDRSAIAYSNPVTVTTQANPNLCSNGDGLNGFYYLPSEVSGTWEGLVRTDAQIHFDWEHGSPVPTDGSAPADHFAVAWYGEIEPQFTSEYTFYGFSDDFARVWVDGQMIFDNTQTYGGSWASGKISLQAGQRYAILVEYREMTDTAKISLQWASSSFKREVIPQCRLFKTE